MFDYSLLTSNTDALLAGLWLTVRLCAGGIALGLAGGLVLVALRQLLGARLRPLYQGYVGLFRGTPFLVQLYLVYYGGPHLGIDLSAEQVGLFGLACYGAAYFAEIFRTGFDAVPRGQLEAARDLGLGRLQALRWVVWPQALSRCLPPLVGQTVILIKESSVLSIITIPELTTVAMRIATENFSVLEPYLVLALAYWALTLGVSLVGGRLEHRFTRHLVRAA